ncbi:hypothetical protein ACFVY9_00745 [Streptomyces sp. NPDC059544]|uniref:hypothetical protein n=1 Tax=Streptomyces sp. NPDC059544 TaxID=3346861 RepID=UPI0036CB4DA8
MTYDLADLHRGVLAAVTEMLAADPDQPDSQRLANTLMGELVDKDTPGTVSVLTSTLNAILDALADERGTTTQALWEQYATQVNLNIAAAEAA